MVGNEWLCAMKPCLRLKGSPPQAGLELGTARSVGQPLTYGYLCSISNDELAIFLCERKPYNSMQVYEIISLFQSNSCWCWCQKNKFSYLYRKFPRPYFWKKRN